MKSNIRRHWGTVVALLSMTLVPGLPASAFLINVYNVGVQEYVNDNTGHYFLAADSTDTSAIASGAAGPGWRVTSNSFEAYIPGYSGGQPVYRFYAPGPNSHVYTANPAEIEILRAPGSGWIDEGVKFRIEVPTAGVCPSYAPAAIHRLYNNRFIYNDSAHRYVFDDALRATMVAAGWIDEGVVFCSTYAAASPTVHLQLIANNVRPTADCQNEAINVGPCIGMKSLPVSLPNHIVAWSPPFYVTRGPDWYAAYGVLTGADADVYTAQPITDEGAVLAHTYLQGFLSNGTSGLFGIHAASADATSNLASIDEVYQVGTAAPGAGQADARVYPWRYANENHVDLQFEMTVATVRRSNAQSHGFGAALIEFRDVVSGQSIDVTVLTYGTIAPGDFVGVNDPATGNVWVSTTFGDAMLFGTNLGSGYVACSGDGACTGNTIHTFGLRLDAGDFTGILARARAVNPALSADKGNYILVKYLVSHGVLGQAEVGVTQNNTSLSVYGY